MDLNGEKNKKHMYSRMYRVLVEMQNYTVFKWCWIWIYLYTPYAIIVVGEHALRSVYLSHFPNYMIILKQFNFKWIYNCCLYVIPLIFFTRLQWNCAVRIDFFSTVFYCSIECTLSIINNISSNRNVFVRRTTKRNRIIPKLMTLMICFVHSPIKT